MEVECVLVVEEVRFKVRFESGVRRRKAYFKRDIIPYFRCKIIERCFAKFSENPRLLEKMLISRT